MSKISVRMPAEIREYHMKIFAGMTARMLISAGIVAFVCLPLYYCGTVVWGWNEDIVAWSAILIGLPIGIIGFKKIHNMPAERFAVAAFKFYLFPAKRIAKTSNVFRVENEKLKSKELPRTRKEQKAYEKYKKQASLERTVLLMEAEERGDLTYTSADLDNLVTAKEPGTGGGKKPENPKKPQKSEKERKKPKWEQEAEAIESKMGEDAFYAPTKKELKLLKRLADKRLEMRRIELERRKEEAQRQSNKMKKRRNVEFHIPTSVADTIPIVATYQEGMMEVAPNKYSKAYLLSDINYKTAQHEEQVDIFCRLRDFYNSFNENVHIQICVDNRVISMAEREREIYYKPAGDGYDKHRTEYNRILGIQMSQGNNNMRVEKYLVLTIDAAEPLEALMQFRKLDVEVRNNLLKIGVQAHRLSTNERLSYFHDKFRPGHEGQFRINYDFLIKEGLSEKDYIGPSSFFFGKVNSMMMGDNYYRILYMTAFPASLDDEIMRSIYDVDFPVTVNFNIQPTKQSRSTQLVGSQLSGVKKDKMDAERRAISGGWSPENIRQDIKDSYEQYNQLHEDMKSNNQKLFFNYFTVMVGGKTEQELENNCAVLERRAGEHQVQLLALDYQQEEGFKSTLPFGYSSKDFCIDRTMTSESTTVFIPFTCTELNEVGGFVYGLNAISRNFVMVNRTTMRTGSGFVLGSSGSGKSFNTKKEIVGLFLKDGISSFIIIDPENEYGDFVRAFGGEVIRISPDSDNCLSPMDMPEDYGLEDENDNPETTPLHIKKIKAIKRKSGAIMAVLERMISVDGNADVSTITPRQKTIIDSCVRAVYREYLDHDFDPAYLPTMLDLQDELDKYKNESDEANELAMGVQYYTRGSMDVFAHRTNVDIKKRMVCFNIRDMGEQLQMITNVILFDYIWNEGIKNKHRGNAYTYVYADEIHVMFKSRYAADFFRTLYTRGRKYGIIVTGITQNCSALLRTEHARVMIGNSDYLMILNQKAEDLSVLTNILHISEEQKVFVSGVNPGCGLLYAHETIVPFTDDFPKDSYLYQLMSTRFAENLSETEAQAQINAIMQS